MSDRSSVAVSLQSPIASKVRDIGEKMQGVHKKYVAPISLDKVHNDQFMDNQKSDTVDNVSIHKNNNKGRGDGPTLSNEIEYKLLCDINTSVADYKFLIALLNCKNKINVHNNIVNEYFSAWRAQTGFDFGFVPLGDFVMPSELTQAGNFIECPIEAHKYVKQSGKPNFLGCRVPVKSLLNAKVWKEMLSGNWNGIWFSP